MSDLDDVLARSMPPAILYPATALFILVQLYVFWRIRHRVANFVVFAAWFRYMASAYHAITYKPAFLGMSWNALGSVAVFGLGLLLIRHRNLRLKFLVPCYVLIAIVAISGLVNGNYSGIINVTVKFGYFIVVTLGVFEAMERFGPRRFMAMLLWAFVPPLVLQALSVIFGISKGTEAGVSYIGGYNHEAAFSVTLATCFLVACFANGLNRHLRNGLLLICLVGIYLANYRTTIAAIAPLVVAQFTLGLTSRFVPNQRALVGIAMLVLSVIGVIAASWYLRERFLDVVVVVESGGMIKPPEDFTYQEARLMSGRPYLWSQYIYAYLDSGRYLLGFGPESWSGTMPTYAHNTLISYLYEYGALGVIALAYFWASMVVAAWRVRQGSRVKLLAAHLSFILLSMSTMPLWMIEGNILYGIICGFTLHLMRRRPVYAGKLAFREPTEHMRSAELVVPYRRSAGTVQR